MKTIYRRNCRNCNKPFETTYKKKLSCCRDCTQHFNNHKDTGVYGEGKIKCLVCGLWFIKPVAHVWQVHKMSEHEYKEQFDLPFKRGIIPEWHREELAKNVKENGTIANLKKGIHRRYTAGDPRAKIVTGWKGRNGSKGYQGE